MIEIFWGEGEGGGGVGGLIVRRPDMGLWAG